MFCRCHHPGLSARHQTSSDATGTAPGSAALSARTDLGRRSVLRGLGVCGTALLVSGCRTDLASVLGQVQILPPSVVRSISLQMWDNVRASTPVSDNETLNRIVQRVGQRIVGVLESTERSWEFVVFDTPQINAFALPGGKVGVHKGILGVMESEAQLAAVMGHEISHVTAQHGVQRINAQLSSRMALAAGQLALYFGNVPYWRPIAAALGLGVVYGIILPYSRYQEEEADSIGLRYMAKAGYDPHEALTFWRTMSELAQQYQQVDFLSTHPSSASRLEALRDQLPAVMPLYQGAAKL